VINREFAMAICAKESRGREWNFPIYNKRGTLNIPPPIPKPAEMIAIRKTEKKITKISKRIVIIVYGTTK
jgi:hypothetical protein